MKTLDDSAAIFNYHRNMMALHGAKSSLALGWLTKADQQIRFKALAGIANLNDKTILDAGCGYGDLYAYLSQSYRLSHYYGVEQIPELLETAQNNLSHLSNVTLISANFTMADLPLVDYVFASGSLNYKSEDPDHVYKSITKLFELCKMGVAFNLLKSISGKGLIIAHNPDLILAHCRTLSSNVVFNSDYSEQDFTIWMYR